jgi:hypothetical protein
VKDGPLEAIDPLSVGGGGWQSESRAAAMDAVRAAAMGCATQRAEKKPGAKAGLCLIMCVGILEHQVRHSLACGLNG